MYIVNVEIFARFNQIGSLNAQNSDKNVCLTFLWGGGGYKVLMGAGWNNSCRPVYIILYNNILLYNM